MRPPAAACPPLSSRAASIGHKDSATNDEITTAIASTKPNSVNRRPAVPGRNAIGTNTETRVAVVARTAKNTCRVPSTAAARGLAPRARCRWMFSTTTIASSTIMPVASTRASSVRMLIEKPSSQIAATVPMSAMGIAVAGIRVGRTAPMNAKMTATTTATAMDRVVNTSRTELRMKRASSEILTISTSSRRRLRVWTDLSTAAEILIVFDLARRTTPRPTTLRPFSRL